MKLLVILVAFFSCSELLAGGAAMTAIAGISAADSMDRITKGKNKGWVSSFLSDNEFPLEEIMVVTEADMNNRGAMKAHLVIVYDKELLHELSTMSSRRYFNMVDQLIRDHPDKMKIYSWDLIAEDRIRPWQKINTLKETMNPLGGFMFADYNNSMMEQRARIPYYEKIKVVFKKDTFNIVYEDQSWDTGKINDITKHKEYDDDDSWF